MVRPLNPRPARSATPPTSVTSVCSPAIRASAAPMIGTGVLILPGHAAHSAGPLSLAAWALLVAYSYPFALVFARLAVRHPTSHGLSGVVQLAFGSRWSRLTSRRGT